VKFLQRRKCDDSGFDIGTDFYFDSDFDWMIVMHAVIDYCIDVAIGFYLYKTMK